jgi:hypothetical protein
LGLRFLIDEDCLLSLETLLNNKGHDAIHGKTSNTHCGLIILRFPFEAIAAQERQQKEKLAIYLRTLGINLGEVCLESYKFP